MAFQDFLVHGNTCQQCKTTLVRVPQSIYPIAEMLPDDNSIVCLDCAAVGSYEGVLGRGDGLIRGILTTRQRHEIAARLA